MKYLLCYLTLALALCCAKSPPAPLPPTGLTLAEKQGLVLRFVYLSDINEVHAVVFSDKPAYWLYHGMSLAYLDSAAQLAAAGTQVFPAVTLEVVPATRPAQASATSRRTQSR